MPDKDAGTPRVLLVRHGETEWTISGRYTGKTDVPLTRAGEEQVSSSAQVIVGPKKVIDPSKITHLFISPRTRALRTYELLFDASTRRELEDNAEITEDIREWDYGQASSRVAGQRSYVSQLLIIYLASRSLTKNVS
ncbi:phosphoglycerate mutase-like protein [Mollisia scopiformis]|uniref:Phosphoglycerate mutase-like protein n=1 Tax=Mollisia scopiformis TaxID=149040 RepID=A0A194X744_MOLSC|nr:phosphoglycerate mutase-like protein [Mollisia scopiformis]KUJ15632.1 phosphoglycerate mutase-like protein [Mollisia scopiformis]